MTHKFAREENHNTQLTSRQIHDSRDTGPDTENTNHDPDMGFYRLLIGKNFEKPYNNIAYSPLYNVIVNVLSI